MDRVMGQWELVPTISMQLGQVHQCETPECHRDTDPSRSDIRLAGHGRKGQPMYVLTTGQI